MPRLAAPLILASASPRRLELLRSVGIDLDVAPVDADETRHPNESARDYVLRVANEKLEAALDRLVDRSPAPFVLAGDTSVVLDADVLGKPRDDDDAFAMVRSLAGRSHRVLTAIALGRVGVGRLADDLVATEVRFRDASDAAIRRYVATGEGRDKAGAYAIQGIGGGFVAGIVGSYSNVVGLPVAETLLLLERGGALLEWP